MGHPRLSQFSCHTTDAREKINGKVIGFLSETDTDSKGGAAYFNGEGVPAKLFHIELFPPFDNIDLEENEFDQSKITNERRRVRLCIGTQKAVSIRKILEHNWVDIRYIQ